MSCHVRSTKLIYKNIHAKDCNFHQRWMQTMAIPKRKNTFLDSFNECFSSVWLPKWSQSWNGPCMSMFDLFLLIWIWITSNWNNWHSLACQSVEFYTMRPFGGSKTSTRTLSFWEIPVAFFQAALLCPRSSPQRSNMRAWKLQLQVLGQGTLIFRWKWSSNHQLMAGSMLVAFLQ